MNKKYIVACNEGKCCCLLCNYAEHPENATHLTTMVVGLFLLFFDYV